MTLTQWDIRKPSGTKSSSYILRTNWNKVLKANLKTTSELNVENLNLMRMENIIKEIEERGREWRLGFSSGSAM